MADPVDEAPTRRISLTKTQRESAVGAELLSLCQTVTADGSLSDQEVEALREWLRQHRAADLPAINHLIPVIDGIVADGRVSADERRQLFLAIEAVLPIDVRAVAKRARRTVEEKERDRVQLQRKLEKQQALEERERSSPIEHFDFMVAGCRYEGRPSVIDAHAIAGGRVYLVRDRRNRYSRNAVEVRTGDGYQIGYVPEEEAIDLAPLLDAAHPYEAEVKKILRGGRYPIPVIVADLYRSDATVPGLVTPATPVPLQRPAATRPRAVGFVLLVLVVVLVIAYLLR